MAFDLERWKEDVKGRLPGWRQTMNTVGAQSVYGFLASMTLFPVAAAAGQGDWAALMAVGQVVGGVGANLLANVLQTWKDRTDEPEAQAEVASILVEQAAAQPALRDALDEVLEKLEILPLAQQALSVQERQWFAETLRQELSSLGNLDRFSAMVIGGVNVQGEGNVVAGERSVVGEDLERNLIATGDHSRQVQAQTYIEQQITNPDPAQAQAAQARFRYLKKLQQQCNVLPLAALGGDEELGDEVRLDQIYVDLDTRTQIPFIVEEEKSERWGFREDRPLKALEAVTQQKRLVVLGDPGSGKSTFVKQLASWLIAASLGEREILQGWDKDTLPIFTVLRDLAPRLAELELSELSSLEQDRLLVEAIRAQWVADLQSLRVGVFAEELEQLLDDGRVLLIFDGLDEVPANVREKVRRAVRALLVEYPTLERIIVTCRIRSYIGTAVLPGFAVETLAPFDSEKIERFVRAWYRAQVNLGRVDAPKAEDKIRDLQGAALAQDLRELSSNPMLLTTMAIIHQREVGLPRERVRLYSLGVQVLLNRWQKRKGISVSDKLSSVLLDDRKLRTLLERIAYEMHARGRRGEEADLSRGELLTLLEQPEHLGDAGLASEFLDYVDLRAGLLVGSGGEYEEGGQHPLIYTFPHRTFQEYLVGCHMVNQRAVGREYWRRLQEGDIWYLAAQLGAEELLYERRNTTSFLDLAYDLCPEAAPSTLAKWRAVLLSGHMAALIGHQEIKRDVEQPGGGTVYLNRLLPSLSQTMRKSPLAPVDRAEAGRILARLGDPRVEVSTLGEMEFSWIPAGPFLMKSEHSMNRFSDDARTSVRGTPSIQVELDYGYWIALYPVTNAQFQKFIEADGYSKAEYWVEAQTRGFWSEQGLVSGEISFTEEGEDEIELTTIRTAPRNYGTPFDFSNHPVVGVSWYEAAAFSQWLTEQWHENGLLPEGWRVDLPSEIEWEKAATGGLMIPSEPRIKVASTGLDENPTNEEITVYMNPLPERTYPWGDEHTVYLTNCAEVSIAATSAVGCFPQGKSVYGSEEMSGNIWEWTRTEHEARQYSPLITSLSTSTEGKYRGCRGGSFVLPLDTARCGVCDPDLALRVLSSVGFRLVVVPSAVINSSPV